MGNKTMNQCLNCWAWYPTRVGESSAEYCCKSCMTNPLGCRCQHGEFGVPEACDWKDEEGRDFRTVNLDGLKGASREYVHTHA
jgi:hypothetical protein